jgi:hypothetical protein
MGLVAALTAVLVARHGVLRAVGQALVADDPIHPADAIVIAIDAGGAGVLEAADLVHTGIAHRVAVFVEPTTRVSRELDRRRIDNESESARQVRQLHALGVEWVEQIGEALGTESEGTVLPGWCDTHRFRSIVVVSNADHTRRLRRVLRREMKGRATTIMVRRARYSEFDPDEWWRERGSARTGIVELEKLLLDIVRHPL